ncbi:DUF1353 domain-containing protein [Mangrovivirga cuniculi]|uniref:DUF1353 domain-containing protein n=1 Tax=Mangrovivirga cuniculi TaxID=2715131 RepID=A0A4D7K4A0_9BACT|nr:DUF1353 domain-containing protein [Mangrovivirga cuniculi]QCK15644.1 hypothetical protein DCC35_13270 [Mangrovivirga cuniculi]
MNKEINYTSEIEQVCLKNGKHKIWKFVEKNDFSYTTDILKNRVCDFNWLSISKDGKITVKGSYKDGYAWDGCTPKMNLFHITWGNFDGKLKRFGKGNYKPYTYYASMVHDVLYQYKRCAPITRKEADRIFYNMLKESGFMWTPVFYLGVRAFGWWFCGWKYKTTKEVEDGLKDEAEK